MANTTRRILIVDGNHSFRESLRQFFHSLGHEALQAETGPQALDQISSVCPDLIIMDAQLSGMNADEVTARLKRINSTRHIPIIISSGWTTACNVEERIYRALAAGAEEVLYKPLQLPMLRDVLRSYLTT